MATDALDSNDFTVDQRRRLLELILSKASPQKGCEWCGGSWGINARPGSPILLTAATNRLEMKADFATLHPCAILHCRTCGNTKLFSLGTLGFDDLEGTP